MPTYRQPGISTLLQVLLSIQSLILVPDPYFNEPGFEDNKGTKQGDSQSQAYNVTCRKQTMEVAIVRYLEKPDIYPEFEQVVRNHFTMKRHLIDKLFLGKDPVKKADELLVENYTRAWKAFEGQEPAFVSPDTP